MKQIIDNLYVGSMYDYDCLGPGVLNFAILGACKEPLHRRYAKMRGEDKPGYTMRSMPSDEPEYLWAERDHALYLNLVDAREPKYFSKYVFEKALSFIENEIANGRKVLIVCNQGESRAPSIALLYLIEHGYFDKCECFYEVVREFKDKYYENYNPGSGIYEFCKEYWRNK